MSNALIQNMEKLVTLDAEAVASILAVCKYKTIKKKDFLLQEGDGMKHYVFVEEGCLRSYSVDENGFEHILQFAPPGWWIGDMRSLLQQTPASLNIDAIDDSKVILIAVADMVKLYDRVPTLDRFFRILSERSLAALQHRVIDSLSLSAKERYNNFCKLYPSLITCLPQKYVASYIGITPEFLSKMLKQPLKK